MLLGADLDKIRPPIPEFTIFGGMMVDRTDIGHLLAIRKSARSLAPCSEDSGALRRRPAVRGARGSRLVMGNALIGRFLVSLSKRGVDILLRTEVQDLITGNGAVTGAVLKANQHHAARDRHARRRAGRRRLHPTSRHGVDNCCQRTETYSPSAPGHTGAMQDIALKLGARLGEGNFDNAFWAPVSIRRRADGSTAVSRISSWIAASPAPFASTGAADASSTKSNSYHVFGRAMFEHNRLVPCIPCFIITDAVGLRKYGLGMVRMGTSNLAPYLADGYLTSGTTIAELAEQDRRSGKQPGRAPSRR